MEIINGPVAIISTIVMFGVLGFIKYFLVKKNKLRQRRQNDRDDFYKLSGSTDFYDPNDPVSPHYQNTKHPG